MFGKPVLRKELSGQRQVQHGLSYEYVYEIGQNDTIANCLLTPGLALPADANAEIQSAFYAKPQQPAGVLLVHVSALLVRPYPGTVLSTNGDLTERFDSRRVLERNNDRIRVRLAFYGKNTCFTPGSDGWKYTVPTAKPLGDGATLDSIVTLATAWTGYDVPRAENIQINVNWLVQTGELLVDFVGEAIWW